MHNVDQKQLTISSLAPSVLVAGRPHRLNGINLPPVLKGFYAGLAMKCYSEGWTKSSKVAYEELYEAREQQLVYTGTIETD